MKIQTYLIPLSLLANIFLAGGIIYLVQKKALPPAKPAQGEMGQESKKYKIAVFEPVSHPAIEEIEKGFTDTLGQSSAGQYSFKVFNAQGNKTLMRAQAEEIVQDNYDLIFSIAAAPTQMVKEVTQKKQRPTPIVFAAVDDPVAMGVIATLESSGNNVTGVTEFRDYKEEVDLLLTLKPDVKNVLLVYDPTQGTGLEKYKNALKKILAAKNINLEAIEVFQANEIQQKVLGSLEHTDVVMVLADNTVVAGIDSLINAANRFNVTLLAADLNSGDKGAALSYGVREYDYGVEGAQKAQAILEQHKQPTQIPSSMIKKPHFKINKRMLSNQGLSKVSPALLRLIEIGQVI